MKPMDIGPKSDLIFEYLKLWKVEHFDNLKTKHFLLRLVESIETFEFSLIKSDIFFLWKLRIHLK